VSIQNPNQTPIPVTYPVNIIVDGQPCLLVGGGRVAAHKIMGLRKAGASVTVVAPEITPELAANPDLTWLARPYEQGDIDGFRLVVTATGDTVVDSAVATDARAAGILVNSADDPSNCDFILPAIVRAGDLTVTVSTRGRSPAIATWLRKRLEAQIDDPYQQLLDLAAEARFELKRAAGTSEHPSWGEGLDAAFQHLRLGDPETAFSVLRKSLGLNPDGLDQHSFDQNDTTNAPSRARTRHFWR
jgi:precorrin-2 dehydrogenase/sirohydrochlorin ferrochelatase